MNHNVKQTKRAAPTVAAAIIALFMGGRALAQLPRDLIEEALDQNVEHIAIENLPIRDALSRLEQETGLRFALDSAVADLMPYGERTKVTIEIRNMSVRQGLTRVCDGLGLQLRVADDRVRLEPAPVLERLGRPMTIADVNLLDQVASSPWPAIRTNKAVTLEFRFDPELNAPGLLNDTIAQIPNASALRQLEVATATLGWVWRPDGMRIVFEPRGEDVLRRLDRPLDMTYERVPLDELLVDLGRRIGVTMMFEPAALKRVDARDRVVDLIQHGVSVRQTLERICGNTGLRYQVTDDGVEILAPLDATAGPQAQTIQHWVRIELEIRPGVKMDVFLRQDQLPADISEECARQLDELFATSRPAGRDD